MEKLESLYIASRTLNATATVENTMTVPQKVKHRSTI